jgi:radical SAM protein with 4Fe4S-binding SPASM domain
MGFIDTRLRDYFAHNPGCAACEFRNRCAGGCRGRVASVAGGDNLLARDEDTCAFFRGGWYEKLLKLKEQKN